MNIRMLVYILGKVLLIEGALMLMPVICGLFYGEVQVFYYIGLAAIYIGAGFLISLKKPKNMTIFIKDGCVATALSWLVLSVCGCFHRCNVRDGIRLYHDRCKHTYRR